MAPVTEFALLPLKAGQYPDDPDSETGKTLRSLISTLLKQDGAQRVYWGREIENPDMLRFFVDWDSLQDHKDFIGTPQYKPFLEGFLSIVDGTPVLYHSPMTPHPPTNALGKTHAPFTEIITVFFPKDYSSDDQTKVDNDLAKLTKVVEEKAEGFHGAAGGWVIEDVAIPGAAEDAEKAKVSVSFIGWDSMEANRAFQKTDTFRENIHLLKDAKDKRHMVVVHVSANEVERPS